VRYSPGDDGAFALAVALLTLTVKCCGQLEHIEGVESSLERLKTLLDLIRHEQDYYRAREHRHRQSACGCPCVVHHDAMAVSNRVRCVASAAIDSNNARVMWYTVMEIVTLGVLYGFQSFILHKWFSDRGFLAKRQWV
jgi:hypothetical protein